MALVYYPLIYALFCLLLTSPLHALNDSPTSPTTTTSPSCLSPPSQCQTSGAPSFSVLQDMATITQRRVSAIIEGARKKTSISSWLSTLESNGKWPDSDINYTSGCPARRANWPAQEHWSRITTMAAAWHSVLPSAEQFNGDADLRRAISLAMDYWFINDFANSACLDAGGTPSCPCGTPGFWNTNWYSNIILIPNFVSQSCLLLNDTLSEFQLQSCAAIPARSYAAFLRRDLHGLGQLTGANTLDVAKVGIDLALLTANASLITDAYRRVHNEMIVEDDIMADGIRADGSFGQHAGILYNGNYGKDYTNDVLDLELAAAGTQFSAGEESRKAFITLFDGHQWMIYRNILTGVLHWDFGVLGRFISFPVDDNQATAEIKLNLTKVKTLGEQWHSGSMVSFADSLSERTDYANAGKLVGNRMFFTNDYMVHRGENYITAVKMYSSRTKNTECTNSQNPFGFHLSDFATRTYVRGDEYEDIAASWDWNAVPGTTSDGETPLTCGEARFTGIESFVGGVSDGRLGIAAMRYANPHGAGSSRLRWQKATFFLDNDVQHTLVSGIYSANASASVVSVLDQRRYAGQVFVDSVVNPAPSLRRRRRRYRRRPAQQQQNPTSSAVSGGDVRSLWHGNVGYTFLAEAPVDLVVKVWNATGDWSVIGTSWQPPTTVELFAASLTHKTLDAAIAYTAYPGTMSVSAFVEKSRTSRVCTAHNDERVSAVMSGDGNEQERTAMAVFWDTDGGTATFDLSVPARDAGRDRHGDGAPVTVTIASDSNAAVIYRLHGGAITVSDPSQTVKAVKLTIAWDDGLNLNGRISGSTRSLIFDMPTGGLAGQSVTRYL